MSLLNKGVQTDTVLGLTPASNAWHAARIRTPQNRSIMDTIRFTCDLDQVPAVAGRLAHYGLRFCMHSSYSEQEEITDTTIILVYETNLGNLRTALTRNAGSLPIPTTSMKEIL